MAIRWHEVYDDALSSSDIVAVWVVVTAHLGREPTRSEITADRRAANRYVATSNRQLLRITVPIRGRARKVLVLASPDADIDDVDRLAAVAGGHDGV